MIGTAHEEAWNLRLLPPAPAIHSAFICFINSHATKKEFQIRPSVTSPPAHPFQCLDVSMRNHSSHALYRNTDYSVYCKWQITALSFVSASKQPCPVHNSNLYHCTYTTRQHRSRWIRSAFGHKHTTARYRDTFSSANVQRLQIQAPAARCERRSEHRDISCSVSSRQAKQKQCHSTTTFQQTHLASGMPGRSGQGHEEDGSRLMID